MILDVAACEWMKLDLATTPATVPTDWEASIDDGATYKAATEIPGINSAGETIPCSAWLVAGPNYGGSETPDFTTTLAWTNVKVRLIEAPETVIRSGLYIDTQNL